MAAQCVSLYSLSTRKRLDRIRLTGLLTKMTGMLPVIFITFTFCQSVNSYILTAPLTVANLNAAPLCISTGTSLENLPDTDE